MFKFFKKKQKLDVELLSKIEEELVLSDVGLEISSYIVNKLRKTSLDKEIVEEQLITEVKKIISDYISNYFISKELLEKIKEHKKNNSSPYVIVVSGVNGSGKTTTIAKLSNLLKENNFKILLAPCDTFRAAAQEQLHHWSKIIKVDFFESTTKQPSALAYQALEYAQNNNYEVLIIDTAGRLDNNANLMNELSKIETTLKKISHTTPHENILILDGTLGQTSYSQAINFAKYINITGLIITKLDSQYKGGVLISIVKTLKVPIYFIGTGEKEKDLSNFYFDEYLDKLINIDS